MEPLLPIFRCIFEIKKNYTTLIIFLKKQNH